MGGACSVQGPESLPGESGMGHSKLRCVDGVSVWRPVACPCSFSHFPLFCGGGAVGLIPSTGRAQEEKEGRSRIKHCGAHGTGMCVHVENCRQAGAGGEGPAASVGVLI